MKDQGVETRWQILDAAMQHFAECGYVGASISKIAEDAGVSKSLIFWYFENKEALFQSLVDRFVSNCIASLEMNSPPGDAQSKIEYLIDTYWKFIHKNFKFVRIFMNWFMQIAHKKKPKAQKLQNIHAKFREILENHLRDGVAAGLFRKDLDIKSTGLYIISCLEGILLQIVIEGIDFSDLENDFISILKANLFKGLLVCENR